MSTPKRKKTVTHQPPTLKNNRQTRRQRREVLTCVLVLSLCTTSSPGYLRVRLAVSMNTGRKRSYQSMKVMISDDFLWPVFIFSV